MINFALIIDPASGPTDVLHEFELCGNIFTSRPYDELQSSQHPQSFPMIKSRFRVTLSRLSVLTGSCYER